MMATEETPDPTQLHESNVDGIIDITTSETTPEETRVKWCLGNCTVDKAIIQFTILCFCICCTIITCVINITLDSEKSSSWVNLLTAMRGIIMPQTFLASSQTLESTQQGEGTS
jgi:hypothetical protein